MADATTAPDMKPNAKVQTARSGAASTLDRHECVRAGVASVRIEGGDVTAETQALLDQWAAGDLTEAALMQAILAPYARQP